MPSVIFTATDVKERRTEVLEAAARDRALVRAVDGTALVFTRLDVVERLEAVGRWAIVLHQLDQGVFPAPIGWAKHLDDDDRHEFVKELWQLLDDLTNEAADVQQLDETIAAWRASALAVADPDRRQVLLGETSARDFVPARRP
jgi:hypothetical protein